jgi:hypothetical protein
LKAKGFKVLSFSGSWQVSLNKRSLLGLYNFKRHEQGKQGGLKSFQDFN